VVYMRLLQVAATCGHFGGVLRPKILG
jgi:hypothetical protein